MTCSSGPSFTLFCVFTQYTKLLHPGGLCKTKSFPVLFYCMTIFDMAADQGRSQSFSFGGGTGGASFATRGAVNGLCRTLMQ